MPQEVDLRNYSVNFASENRAANLRSAAKNALTEFKSESVLQIDAFTGNTTQLQIDAGAFAEGDYVGTALAQVQQLAAPLGFVSGELVEFVPDQYVQTTGSRASIVHLHQRYRGIPVFQMSRSVQFDAASRVRRISGNHVNLPGVISTESKLSALHAVQFAAQHVAVPAQDYHDHFGGTQAPDPIDLSDFSPKVILRFNEPSQPTVVDAAPFARPIATSLVLFYMGDRTILGWKMEITLPDFLAEYEVIVSAEDPQKPQILYCSPLSHSATGQGNVYHESPGRTPRQMIDFPRQASLYPTVLNTPPASFPDDWIGSDECIGNNVVAILGANGPSLQGNNSGGSVVFDPANDVGDDQKVLNIFYFCNLAHDFFLLLGFDEASGNFQNSNATGTGLGNDAVDARSHSGPVFGTANMLTREDGIPPIMNMGLVAGINRHTAFDADVVLHEYNHGVTNRLVGGRMNRTALQQPQSRSMGEGWADFFALTIQNIDRSTERVVTGDWVTGNASGIRGFPYDSNFPDGFGSIGTGRYHLDSQGRPRVHNIGEIWCATLMEWTRRLISALSNKERSYAIVWQSVMDGLKLTPINPSFLDARDAILQALQDLESSDLITNPEFASARRQAWETFAHFEMGVNASSSGAGFNGINGNQDLPTDL